MKNPHIAIIGAGTIGLSWAALFAATGRQVTVYDPAQDTGARLKDVVKAAAPALTALGWDHAGVQTRLRVVDDPAQAVRGADFVQESVPERLELKHEIYARIEPELTPDAIIGSSTSGLRLSELQQGFAEPGRLILAHPFNPPHLIPLVELMGNDRTEDNVLDTAAQFYESLGKVCVRLHKEVPGHIANRLQAAVWREAIHLAAEGVASVADIDKAVASGPGLRWACLGPTTLFHLGGGAGGIGGFCDHLGPHFEAWWDDLGQPRLTPETVARLKEGMAEITADQDAETLAARRDRLILNHLLASRE
ncbi:3-hydroxyacyl-CoA dehydrogenase family protein [Paracoccus sediminicola]|uniref:3-hydroxyacyl-CoA dehydrogenase family protein n=1 Tax=Paracoccus sediminicola TaxID=3017783 RepID=UPI0022F0473B|nr:3-hydroxyacyl-CoA dehydrogenase NAD-binding domain-containing protein [Paracoccus sediminicola]WBU57399.1 3-hydroxyacyl-CoA dehydrogenase NAD-binding domain-containing protein [Paracoccus sediminicola]